MSSGPNHQCFQRCSHSHRTKRTSQHDSSLYSQSTGWSCSSPIPVPSLFFKSIAFWPTRHKRCERILLIIRPVTNYHFYAGCDRLVEMCPRFIPAEVVALFFVPVVSSLHADKIPNIRFNVTPPPDLLTPSVGLEWRRGTSIDPSRLGNWGCSCNLRYRRRFCPPQSEYYPRKCCLLWVSVERSARNNGSSGDWSLRRRSNRVRHIF